LRSDFEDIHRSIIRLRAEEKVPVQGHPGVAVDYETLRVMETEGEKEFPLVANGKLVKLDVLALLNGIEELPPHRSEAAREGSDMKEAIRVVFSYSHKDEELR